MSKDLNQVKEDLVHTIKAFCQEINGIQTFSGLVSMESRMDDLYKNFLKVKLIDSYDLPLSPIATEIAPQEEAIPETIPVINLSEEPEETPIEEISFIDTTSEETPAFSTATEESTANITSTEDPVDVSITTSNDAAHLNENYPAPANNGATYPRIALDLNDSIAFEKQLFDKDPIAFRATMERINSFASLDGSLAYLNDLYQQNNWNEAQEFYERLKKAVERRFE